LVGRLSVVLGAVVSALVRGLDIRCGCFASAPKLAHYPVLIFRDLALLAIAGILLVWDARNIETKRSCRRGGEPAFEADKKARME